MATTQNSQTSTADPFSSFWGDFFNRVGVSPGAAAAAPAGLSSEALVQMRRAFLDALASYCDEFMRSEQFLQMMKQTMDRSLAFKRQVDQFLSNCYAAGQAPTQADVTDVAGLLRSIESRILDRLAALEQKVAAVEDKRGGGRRAQASRAQRSASRLSAGKRRSKGKRR
jgi:hypothetical protein